ncbi:hypothetical protein, partial [Halorhabdus tiamatea]|uniref:hypothetical protein n=1 Tax=Halorhabdus tiamatea TaxID=430914 RepID=UPI001A7E9790
SAASSYSPTYAPPMRQHRNQFGLNTYLDSIVNVWVENGGISGLVGGGGMYHCVTARIHGLKAVVLRLFSL